MSEKDFTTIEELTILLLYLTAWIEDSNMPNQQFKRSWKGYPWSALDSLNDKNMLYSTKKSKSVTLTKAGEEYAKEMFKKYGLNNS